LADGSLPLAWIRRILGFFALVPFLLIQVGCGSEIEQTKLNPTDDLTLSVMATSVSSSSIRLAITASFNAGNTPLWREDIPAYLAHFDLQASTASFYTDTNVTPGLTYCYRAGGNYFMIGEVYSNRECVTLR
jgi:hypothetical protein